MQWNTLSRLGRVCALMLAAFALSGCSSTMKYYVPGEPADFRALGITQTEAEAQTDASIARRLDRKPLARFPTSIAVVRVQGSGYRSYTSVGRGDGRFTVVTTRDVESQEAFDQIASLPMIAEVAALNSLVTPDRLNTEQDLRGAAANLQGRAKLLCRCKDAGVVAGDAVLQQLPQPPKA